METSACGWLNLKLFITLSTYIRKHIFQQALVGPFYQTTNMVEIPCRMLSEVDSAEVGTGKLKSIFDEFTYKSGYQRTISFVLSRVQSCTVKMFKARGFVELHNVGIT